MKVINQKPEEKTESNTQKDLMMLLRAEFWFLVFPYFLVKKIFDWCTLAQLLQLSDKWTAALAKSLASVLCSVRSPGETSYFIDLTPKTQVVSHLLFSPSYKHHIFHSKETLSIKSSVSLLWCWYLCNLLACTWPDQSSARPKVQQVQPVLCHLSSFRRYKQRYSPVCHVSLLSMTSMKSNILL